MKHKKTFSFIFVLIMLALTSSVFAVNEFSLNVESLVQAGVDSCTFKIYFKNTSTAQMEFAAGQYYFDFNLAALNGGTGTLRVLSSDLTATNQAPRNPQVKITPNGQLWFQVNAVPGAGLGRIILAGDSVMVAYASLKTTSGSLTANALNLIWRTLASGNPYTKIFVYIATVNTEITSSGVFMNYTATSSTPPATPTLVSPITGSTGVSLTPTLTWNASPGATSYRVQVSTDSTFTTSQLDSSNVTGGIITVSLVVPAGKLLNLTTYYWRVNATNASGTSLFSPFWNFQTVTAPPIAPLLTSPLNGATGVSVTPALTWGAVTGATSYRIQISTDAGFTALVWDTAGVGTTTLNVPAGKFVNNTLYYWRVNASNAGGAGPYSTAWNFTTIIAAPIAPVLTSPANGATGIALTPTLTWGVVAGAATYRIQIATDAGFTTLVWDTAGVGITSLIIPSGKFLNNTLYYWKVNATNAGGTGPYSTAWNFTTIVAAPVAPTLLTPSNGATGVSLTTALTWGAVAGATTYRIQISLNSGFTSFVWDTTGVGIASLNIPAGKFANNTPYYWRVSATNAGGTSPYSTVWSFTTIIAAPIAPVLTSPLNGATGVALTPTLSWGAVAGATTYRVQIATDAGFTALVWDTTGVGITSLNVLAGKLNNSVIYYWRVNATNAGGTGPYSTAWNFTTIIAIPVAPVLTSPVNGATGVALSPTLIWGAVAGAASYRIQIATDVGFTALIWDTAGVGTATLIIPSGKFANNTIYYWRVNATNVAGTGPYSTAWNFTTIVAAPIAPVLTSPLNGATGVSLTPALLWGAVTGATTYRIQIATDAGFTALVWDTAGVGTTTLNIPAGKFANNNLYYWRVNASNAGGVGPYSTAWNFTTIVGAPIAPTLLTPSNGATGVSLTTSLTWGAVTGASTYRIQIATDAGFTALVWDTTGVGITSLNIPAGKFLNNTLYYWRVNATNAGGTGPYSVAWNFTTIIAAPAAPTLVTPLNGATNVSLTTALTWTFSPTTVSGRLQIATDAGFTALVWDTTGVTTTSVNIPTGKLGNSTVYYWRMNGTNAGGTSAWTAGWNFTTIIGAPIAPVLTLPANGATGIALTPTLTWGAVASATSYRIQISLNSGFTSFVWDTAGVGTTSLNIPAGKFANNTLYYWRVSATNAGGTGPYSTVWNFTTIIAAPAAPTLVTPLNGATGVSLTPAMTWTVAPTTVSTRLQIATDAGFTALVWDTTGVTTTLVNVPSGKLTNSTIYYWRMNGTNAGGTSAWTTGWNFTTIVAAPGAPTLVTPVNGATNVLLTTVMTWSIAGGTLSSRLQIATDAGFTALVWDTTGVTTTSVNVPAGKLNNNVIYYWRMNGTNAGGTSGWTSGWNFTTILAAPAAPTLVSPVNGATNVSLTTALTWTLAPTTASGRIQIATDAGFTALIWDTTGVTTTTVNVPAGKLNNLTVYYWRMNGTNVGGTSAWTAGWNFTTVMAAPIAPILTSPVNGATNVILTPTLTWGAVTGAASYRIQIATDIAFTGMVWDTTGVSIASLNIPAGKLNNTVTYYWRVNATNVGGTSPYSTAWNFTTIVAIPIAPVLTSPVNGAVNVALTPTLSWGAVTGAATYRIQISLNSGFTSFVWDTAGVGITSLAIPSGKFASNTLYYWRVSATNIGGTGPYSAVWNFTTLLPVPVAPVMTSPANGSLGVVLTPTLIWNSVQFASSYRIQLSIDSLFATTVYDTTGVTATQIIVPSGKLTGMTKYFWRVNAANIAGTSPWATTWKFTTLQNLTLNLKVYLEGFWNGTTQVVDTVTVYLANATTPHAFVDSSKIVLSATGTAVPTFTKTVNGNYFLVIKHRNHLETWSALTQSFITNVPVSYDFTTGSGQAFGGNMKQVGTVWVLIVGDENQDGSIDAVDVSDLIIQYGNIGFFSCDFNGDSSVDAADVPFMIANYGLTKVIPAEPNLPPEVRIQKRNVMQQQLNQMFISKTKKTNNNN